MTEFIESHCPVLVPIIFTNDIFNIICSSTKIVLIHEIKKFIACDDIETIFINFLE